MPVRGCELKHRFKNTDPSEADPVISDVVPQTSWFARNTPGDVQRVTQGGKSEYLSVFDILRLAQRSSDTLMKQDIRIVSFGIGRLSTTKLIHLRVSFKFDWLG